MFLFLLYKIYFYGIVFFKRTSQFYLAKNRKEGEVMKILIVAQREDVEKVSLRLLRAFPGAIHEYALSRHEYIAKKDAPYDMVVMYGADMLQACTIESSLNPRTIAALGDRKRTV